MIPHARCMDAKNILAKELAYIQELVYSIGGEALTSRRAFGDSCCKLPAAPSQLSGRIWY